jgi:hypothetical protein
MFPNPEGNDPVVFRRQVDGFTKIQHGTTTPRNLLGLWISVIAVDEESGIGEGLCLGPIPPANINYRPNLLSLAQEELGKLGHETAVSEALMELSDVASHPVAPGVSYRVMFGWKDMPVLRNLDSVLGSFRYGAFRTGTGLALTRKIRKHIYGCEIIVRI